MNVLCYQMKVMREGNLRIGKAKVEEMKRKEENKGAVSQVAVKEKLRQLHGASNL